MAHTSDTKCDVIYATVDVFHSTFKADGTSGSEDTTSLLSPKRWAKCSTAEIQVAVDIL